MEKCRKERNGCLELQDRRAGGWVGGAEGWLVWKQEQLERNIAFLYLEVLKKSSTPKQQGGDRLKKRLESPG